MPSLERCEFFSADDVRLSYLIADQSDGLGELVVFCHGFPGLAYSWRHQLAYAAQHGYRAVALDMRGYGGSDAPASIEDYSLERCRADLLALLCHLGSQDAVFVGHDFGAPVVWYMALTEPQRVRGLLVLSVPYDFDYYGRRGQPDCDEKPSELFARLGARHFLHAHYFQQQGPPEDELEAACGEFLRRIFWALSGQGDLLAAFAAGDPSGGYLDALPPAGAQLPWPWLSKDDFAVYEKSFSRCGFRGALNWYRVADINWRLNSPLRHRQVGVPVAFIAGADDPVLVMSGDEAMDFMRARVPDLRECVLIESAGHWVQQESAARVNETLLRFLESL